MSWEGGVVWYKGRSVPGGGSLGGMVYPWSPGRLESLRQIAEVVAEGATSVPMGHELPTWQAPDGVPHRWLVVPVPEVLEEPDALRVAVTAYWILVAQADEEAEPDAPTSDV